MLNPPRPRLLAGIHSWTVSLAPALVFVFQLAVLATFALIPLPGLFKGLRIPLLISLPDPVQASSLIVPYMVGLAYLAAGLYVFRLRYRDSTGQSFGLFTAGAALAFAGLPGELLQGPGFSWAFAVALAGGALFNLTLVFPQEFHLVERRPWLRLAGYLPALLLVALAFPFSNGARPASAAFGGQISTVIIVLSTVVFLARTVQRYRTAPSPIAREQACLILLASGLAFLPLAGWRLWAFLFSASFSQYLLLFTAVFPLATGFAILCYRLPKSDRLLNQAIVYTLLSLLAAAGYALLVSGLALFFGGTLQPTHPAAVGLMVFLLAVLLNPVRGRVQRLVGAAFSGRQDVYRIRLEEFGPELSRAMELESILSLLRQFILQDLQPAQLHIFVYDPLSGQYRAGPGEQGKPTSDLHFPAAGNLVQSLSNCRDTIFLGDSDALPVLTAAE
ncbi:MAG TPA: hypothetical protein VF498_15030, partial [Anaerolineales bacterium]